MLIDKLAGAKTRFEELNVLVVKPEIISNNNEWKKLVKERAALEPLAEMYDKMHTVISDIEGAKEILGSGDKELAEMAEEELYSKKEELEKLEQEAKVLLLPPDPNDDKNVIMEIRPGAGGDEAGLFGYELMRMYKMYAESKRWRVEDIDLDLTEAGGIKEATFVLSGAGAYSKLKFESGVHRVQRVPATESQGRVHTSTVTVAVLPEVEDVVIDINEKDLKVDTYRSGGAGGQHVNKTESAIRITHIPSGMVVTCQDEKSQIKNRDKAMRVLKSRLYDFYQEQADKEYAETRKLQVGTGDRSERIRTYNFSQGRVTDHRIGMTVYSLDYFLNGDIDEMIEALRIAEQAAKLEKMSE